MLPIDQNLLTEFECTLKSEKKVKAGQSIPLKIFFFKKWAIPGLFFLYFRLFNAQLTVNKCSIYK